MVKFEMVKNKMVKFKMVKHIFYEIFLKVQIGDTGLDAEKAAAPRVADLMQKSENFEKYFHKRQNII